MDLFNAERSKLTQLFAEQRSELLLLVEQVSGRLHQEIKDVEGKAGRRSGSRSELGLFSKMACSITTAEEAALGDCAPRCRDWRRGGGPWRLSAHARQGDRSRDAARQGLGGGHRRAGAR